MRRILSLFTMLMLCGVLAFGQSRVVSGTVTDAKGNPVPYASVIIKGKGGVQTDINGKYSIKVSPGDILVISQTSYDSIEIPVGSLNNITTSLKLKTGDLAEVVVTSAFNTKRTLRSTSSNVQNVTGDQLNTIRAANINNALAGKVAGAQVRSQSAAAIGRETIIRLRGENSLTVGTGPVYVVDGTIIASSNDINPDDVADVTVLQGPAAAALFGPAGSNGAIVVTTKRATKNQPGIGIEINTGVVFDKIYITPNFQNSYAGGADYNLNKYTYQAGQPEGWKALDGKYYHDYSDDASWGPRMAGQEYIPWYAWYPGTERSFKTAALNPSPSNASEFYNTGKTTLTNVNFSRAGDAYNIRASYTNLNIEGLIPNSSLKRNTLTTNFSINMGSKWTLGANINIIQQNSNTENDDGYSNQSTGSFNQWFHRDLDIGIMREMASYRTPEGYYASWNKPNPTAYSASNPDAFYKGNYWMNPYTYFEEIQNDNSRSRVYGDVSLSYKVNNDLKLSGTYRKNQLVVAGSRIYPSAMENSNSQSSFNPYEGTGKAAYGINNSNSNQNTAEFLATYGKKIKDFSVNANAGFTSFSTSLTGSNQNTMGGLNVPGLYSLANSKNAIRYGQAYEKYKQRAVFGTATLGYKNRYFLDGSYRQDYTSAEPPNTHITSYSFGAAVVFSDYIKDKTILSYGKLRASAGKTVAALLPYDLNVIYQPDANQFNGNFLMNEPNTVPSPTLIGSTNNEKEIGIETRWLKNRIGLTVTYWDRTNKDFPVNVTVSQTSGLQSVKVNAGEIAKTGVDVQFFAQVVKSKNLEWNLNAAWGRLLKNEVVELAPGLDRIAISSGSFSTTFAAYAVSAVGQPWGQMFGGGIKRDAASGQPILTDEGKFIKETDVNFGSVLPMYTGGVQNAFTVFKNFTLNINIDYSYGGKFFSLSDFWGTFSGLTARTAILNDKGNSIRDAVLDGGGVHVSGVDNTGKAVDYYVPAQAYYQQFQANNIAEQSIYDLTYVKLRELSVGYRLPIEQMGLGKYIQNATFSILVKNPWLIYSSTRDFDPSEISNVFGEDGQLPGTRSMGVNLKIGF